MKIQTKQLVHYGLILIIGFLVLLRFSFLELDSPSYNKAGINQTDESYYCLTALTQEENEVLPHAKTRNEGRFLFIHNHALTKASLNIFGYNFIGLRFPIVLLSLLTIVMLITIVKKAYTLPTVSVLLLLIYLLTEYQFFVFSRYQTPQAYSLFWITLVLYLVWLYQSKNRVIFLICAVASIVFATLMVYPYVIFLALALGIWILWYSLNQRKLNIIGYSFLGVVLGLTTVYLTLLGYNYTVTEYIDFFKAFSEMRDETLSVFSLFDKALQTPYTNIFRFNSVLFLITVFFLISVVIKKFKVGAFELFVFLGFMALILQSFFVISYPFKKLIMFFPFSILAIGWFIGYCKEKNTMDWLYKAFVILTITLVFALSVKGIFLNNNFGFWDYFACISADMVYSTAIVWIQIILVLVFLLYFVYSLLLNKRININYVIIIMLVNSTMFLGEYLLNASYTRKEDLSKFTPVVSGNYIIGDFSHAYSFYTEGMPMFSSYDYKFERLLNFTELIERAKDKDIYYIHSNNCSDAIEDTVLLDGVQFIQTDYSNKEDRLILYRMSKGE